MTTCVNCGAENEPGAAFCKSCHHFLAWTPGDEDDEEVATTARPLSSPTQARGSPPPPVVASRPEPQPERPLPPQAEPEPDAAPESYAAPVLQTDAAPASQAAPEPPEPEPQPQATEPRPVWHAEPPPEPEPQARPEPEPLATAPGVVEPDAVQNVLHSVAQGRSLALANGREDLAEHLNLAREQIEHEVVSVAVVGEFKRGKSTLINALLRTAVCPVDADVVTAIPTVVRYGERLGIVAHPEPTDDDPSPEPVPVPLDQLEAFVSEAGNPNNRRRLRAVEVAIPHPLLRTGLCLVDTPGVGGLDSAHGLITLSALTDAQGVLLVTDASQEFTRAELEFMQSAVERCSNAACVLTKTDLYPQWRRILEADRAHLDAADLHVTLFAVSSFLALAADDDPGLAAESGLPDLIGYVLNTVVATARARTVESAEAEVEYVAAQLADRFEAERAVLDSPEQAPQVVERLNAARAKSAGLAAANAPWQQVLSDGIQDLVATVEYDLQERLRIVIRDAESIIESGDPRDTWPDIEVWLRRQVIEAAVANHDRMREVADDVAAGVAAAFDLAAGEVTSAVSVVGTDQVAQVRLAAASSLEAPGGRTTAMVIAGRTAMLVPIMIIGTLGHLLLPIIAAPIAVLLGGGIGQKVIRDERKRQIAYRQQQARSAVRKYVDEVAFLVTKDTRDALRVTQRALRDEFQRRAMHLQRSSEAALHAAQSAMAVPPSERQQRAADVERAAAGVIDLRSRRRVEPTQAVVNG